ncbi:MAG: acylphosphatase [Methanoculleaceae archaeon]
MKTVEILVSGRVQGVGFRSCIRKTADILCVRGVATNLSDGRVQVVATGDEMVLEKFISMLYSCPRAVIRDLSVREVEYTEFPDFSIRRGYYQYGTV